jgi:hypothetical protein
MSRFVTAAILGVSFMSAALLSGCACPPPLWEGPVHHLRTPDLSLGPAFPYGWYRTQDVYSGGYDYLGCSEWPGPNP